jgi:murein DD-endopeptidase MepM/ murein hydrolase activator NlpD
MHLRHGCAVPRRGLAYAVAVILCLGLSLSGVHAQDSVPAGGPASIVSGGEPVLLREWPGYDAAVLAPLSDGGALDVAGAPVAAADGSMWLPVYAGGQSGYVPAGYVATAPGAPAALAPEAPVTTDPAVTIDPAAAPAPAAPISPDPAVAPVAGAVATTTEANLRSGPSMDAQILLALPPGTALTVDGPPSNGFVPVTGNGVSGWIAVELLAGGAVPAAPAIVPDPNAVAPAPVVAPLPSPVAPPPVDPAAAAPAAAPAPPPEVTNPTSTGIIWPFAGGEWKVVQGYNNGTHTNRSGFAQYKYALDWARVEGDSAGQPVYAPVSGTIRWTDRGSGGMLIDAGNGYGVAVFHVTVNGDLGRGGTVTRGQQIGTISGPGGDGYASMAHIDITCWRLAEGGQEAVPFVGPNAIAGYEFPDTGGVNQHMGATVTP